ncbi:hypothetical protein C3L23_06620 [Nautilia sp. PV-1]|uniref:OmpP1/FadL family transporter n=1 Tax=Nautilia sp. PV-1 TaxID=2579250 RepID=UPI000FD8994F|nr:outer membrane protein transport protein [Nautilia sp. PV-1]AZV46955.1 hypothetical protein C3L23_06620 [Nautilia sp. PV-1]
MKKILALSLITSSLLLANGYKIPEQSLNGMALSAANVANAHGADAAYYNPANMVFNPDKNSYEFLMSYIYLPSVKFENSDGSVYNSRKETFLVPQFHFVSKDMGGWRWGVSLTTPAGLSKRWDDPIPQAGAKEFTLKTYELNPSIAIQLNNNAALAFGLRAVKSEGIANGTVPGTYSFYLDGTSTDYGWNVAYSLQNDKRDTKFAITYRSKVDLTLKGNANGYLGTYLFNTEGRATLPIPAALNVAFAKTFNKTTVEFVFERTFWSRYKELNFDFNDPVVENSFLGQPKPKYWKNANTYRIGITHQCTEKLTAMLGYSYDNTPIPDSTVDFSLPDSDKNIFSGGLKYKVDDRMSLGFSALYAKQKSRHVTANAALGRPEGTFSDGGALLMAFGMDYSF